MLPPRTDLERGSRTGTPIFGQIFYSTPMEASRSSVAAENYLAVV